MAPLTASPLSITSGPKEPCLTAQRRAMSTLITEYCNHQPHKELTLAVRAKGPSPCRHQGLVEDGWRRRIEDQVRRGERRISPTPELKSDQIYRIRTVPPLPSNPATPVPWGGNNSKWKTGSKHQNLPDCDAEHGFHGAALL